MATMLCTGCGQVGAAPAGRCAHCGSELLLPADAAPAQKYLRERQARIDARHGESPPSTRATATGKVLGRSLGKLFGK